METEESVTMHTEVDNLVQQLNPSIDIVESVPVIVRRKKLNFKNSSAEGSCSCVCISDCSCDENW